MIRFLTVFLPCENIHLTKDVGMIPYMFHKKYNYNSTIASYKNGEYPYLNTEVKGLNQVFIQRRFKSDFLNSVYFILKNFKQYDVIQLYHFSFKNLFILYLFKLLNFNNAKVRVYLKMDQNDNVKNIKISKFRNWQYKFLLNKIDLISLETELLYRFTQKTQFLNGKIKLIPNGFYDNEVKPNLKVIKKENYILTVGLIGDKNKSNEILLEAFALLPEEYGDWKLQLAGKVIPEFSSYLENYFARFPQLKGRIEFLGFISDKSVLDTLYEKAKIFVLTSKAESFGIVFLEAIKFGCTLVSSAITPAYDVTHNERYGKLFEIDNVEDLVLKLKMVIENLDINENYNPSIIQNFAYSKFYWPQIISRIKQDLKIQE